MRAGNSALEIWENLKNATGKDFEVVLGDHRTGDPKELAANPEEVKSKLNCQVEFKLGDIVTYAWA